MNVGVLASPPDPALNSLGGYPEMELLDHTLPLVLIFGGTLVLFSVRTASIHTHSTVQKPLLSHTLASPFHTGLFDNSHSDRGEAKVCVFELHFPTS